LERGEEFEVTKEQAGRPPVGWRALGANPIPKGATLRTNGQLEVEVFDPGEGLLGAGRELRARQASQVEG